MAYSLTANSAVQVSDGLNGTQTIQLSVSAIVPTRPAYCGSGTATTTPATISYGPVTTPKALVIVNDGAQELTVDLGTDSIVLGVSGSTTKLNFLVISAPPAAPDVSTASSTSAYRTFIVE